MCNYCKVSDDSPPSRAISHDQVDQDLVNDIGRTILSNLLMVNLTGSKLEQCPSLEYNMILKVNQDLVLK